MNATGDSDMAFQSLLYWNDLMRRCAQPDCGYLMLFEFQSLLYWNDLMRAYAFAKFARMSCFNPCCIGMTL